MGGVVASFGLCAWTFTADSTNVKTTRPAKIALKRVSGFITLGMDINLARFFVLIEN